MLRAVQKVGLLNLAFPLLFLHFNIDLNIKVTQSHHKKI